MYQNKPAPVYILANLILVQTITMVVIIRTSFFSFCIFLCLITTACHGCQDGKPKQGQKYLRTSANSCLSCRIECIRTNHMDGFDITTSRTYDYAHVAGTTRSLPNYAPSPALPRRAAHLQTLEHVCQLDKADSRAKCGYMGLEVQGYAT